MKYIKTVHVDLPIKAPRDLYARRSTFAQQRGYLMFYRGECALIACHPCAVLTSSCNAVLWFSSNTSPARNTVSAYKLLKKIKHDLISSH